MAVVANQAVAFDKSMLMACPHLGDVLRPGLILDHGLTGSYSGPEVRFEAVHTRSNVFQAQVVIHRVSQFLFASEVMLGRLNGCMAKQKLNLFKFSSSQVA